MCRSSTSGGVLSSSGKMCASIPESRNSIDLSCSRPFTGPDAISNIYCHILAVARRCLSSLARDDRRAQSQRRLLLTSTKHKLILETSSPLSLLRNKHLVDLFLPISTKSTPNTGFSLSLPSDTCQICRCTHLPKESWPPVQLMTLPGTLASKALQLPGDLHAKHRRVIAFERRNKCEA